MTTKRIPFLALAAAAGVALAAASCIARGDGSSSTGAPDGLDVQLCDGETRLALDAAPTDRAGGQAVADALMAEWQRKNPDQPVWPLAQDPAQDPARREQLLYERFQPKKPFDNRYLLGEGQREGHPYRDFEERDITLWERDTMNFVLEGAQVFHDAGRLGSTIAVSCDMCHPDAANTHPETYPKYQTQLGRTVMLREMINWCIEHPVRGQKLAHDDPRMLAMEAYIYAQRKGATLQFGRH